ncbi:MAG: tRNA uridine-5-carboxymethylaminomethyl(34) synthesis enzyme MnmG [Luteibaculum sp.]
MTNFDIIVVGAGHAGNEAAAIAAKLGSRVLLITMNLNTLGQMSCNPAMGGVAKGQIVREIDALGGLSAIVSDHSAIQYRMLNRSKGPAMWSPRSQNDRFVFAQEWRYQLEQLSNLSFYQATVKSLRLRKDKTFEVITSGKDFSCKKLIITAGTFLNAQMHIGSRKDQGGRMGEGSSEELSSVLNDSGFYTARLKTGTPPRIDGRTIDYSKLEIQHGDNEEIQFSFRPRTKKKLEQRPCYLAYTNPTVHEILSEGFDESPMYSGTIKGAGPRYCPSIEDKITRFSERNRHQIFVEPEGLFTQETYLNGFSTSLPESIQEKALRQITGFESAEILKPGYAVEYDFFPPTQLKHSLETKQLDGLFFAGQINGTTGYEEAACQGLIAGINAHLSLSNQEPFVLHRDEAYIGVLIDDLVTKGTEEPYRMFTSRSEYRLLLRQDNADERLYKKAWEIGSISESEYQATQRKYDSIHKKISAIKSTSLNPDEANPILASIESTSLPQKTKAIKVLLRPEVHIENLIQMSPEIAEQLKTENKLDQIENESVEINCKYEGYLERERMLAEKMQRLENINIPNEFRLQELSNLSTEAREKLLKIQPQTIGQAARISGISPSDINVLLVHLGR